MGLSRSFLLNDKDKTIKLYFDFMVEVAVIFGANHSTAQKEMLDALNFEKALANVSDHVFHFHSFCFSFD